MSFDWRAPLKVYWLRCPTALARSKKLRLVRPFKSQSLSQHAMNEAVEFDVFIYGATGFTGQLVAEYPAARDDNRKQIR
jgi:hypothetical protein